MSSATEQPWIEGRLQITAETLAAIDRDALACYPSESCGFVSGPASEPLRLDEALATPNEADKYHRLDPETFPRTSREYFKINEMKAKRAFEQGEAEGRPVKVIYHSHCDCGAYFSAEDAATFASNETLMWPCAFIVVSVVDGRVSERRLWVHRPGTNEFDESTLEVIAD